MDNPDYQSLIRERVISDDGFVSAVFSGHRPRTSPPWVKVTIRPVLVQGSRKLQFQYYDQVKSVTANHDGPEAVGKLDEALSLPFKHYYVRSLRTGIQVQITQRGKALVREQAFEEGPAAVDLSHDRRKRRPLDPAAHGAFLRAVGIMADDGRIKPTMQAKFRQVSEFLRLLESRIPAGGDAADAPGGRTPRVVDLGCGNAYLTFAVYDYLANARGLRPSVTGVDVNALAMERHRDTCRGLGWDGLAFEVSTIAGYQSDPAPEIVLALHACDTATDEALAKAVRWGARHLFAVPCCHHNLQEQMATVRSGTPLDPVLRFGVLKERLGDILTDTLRAQILGILGYRVDIVQFVSPEHTTKNLMLVAEKREGAVDSGLVRQYRELCGMFSVRPHLETLLAEELGRAMGSLPIPPHA